LASRFWVAARGPLDRFDHWGGSSTAPRRLRAETPAAELFSPRELDLARSLSVALYARFCSKARRDP